MPPGPDGGGLLGVSGLSVTYGRRGEAANAVADLDLEVGAGHRDLPALHVDQQVGQDRQRLPTFHDIDDLLQRLEQDLS